MKQCHECGSELGDVETFCPFCGISLKPFTVEGDEENAEESDSTDETVSANLSSEEEERHQSSSEAKEDEDQIGESLSAKEEEEPSDANPVLDDIGLSETIAMSSEEAGETLREGEKEAIVEEGTDGFIDVSSLKKDEESEADHLTDSAAAKGRTDGERLADRFNDEGTPEFADLPDSSEEEEQIEEAVADESTAGSLDEAEEIAESVDASSYDKKEESAEPDEPPIEPDPVEGRAGSDEIASEPAADEAESEEFLEDSTIIMSSFPSSSSDETEKPEKSEEKVVEERESETAESEEFDFEGETVVQTGAGTKLEKSPSVEVDTESDPGADAGSAEESRFDAAASMPEDEVSDFSNTESYAKDDFGDLTHIPSSEIDGAVSELGSEKKILASDTEDGVAELEDSTPETDDESSVRDPGSPVLEVVPEGSADSAVEGEAAVVPDEKAGPLDSASEISEEKPVVEETVGEGEEHDVRTETTPNIGVEDTDGSNKTKLKPLEEGIVLNGRYEIVRRIGGGGMGAVYLANDKNLGGVLRAVKEMVQSYIEQDQQEKAINDFKRESMLLTSLEHSSIPTIYDYFFDEKEARFYLVMKYISGGDLAGRLRAAPEGKLEEAMVVEWGIQIADVLNYLHNRKPPIVYRDLKPANVMIDGNSDKVMLIDFGIARWVNKEEKGVTAVGTMGYAPPELFSGNVEPRSDIYSLGSTMFHLLTGADPQSNPLLIFDFQKHPRPRQINPALSDQIEQILMQAVEYNAESRFMSAADMRDALTSHLERLNAGNVSYGVKESPKAVGLAEQPVFCGFCGQKIVATDMFCAFCGAKQPLAQPGVHSEEYVPAQITAKLFVEGTTDLDAPSFSLEKDENLVGRRDPISNIFPEVDLSKFDPQTKISRKHARIFRDGDKFMLEDLNSSNGTVIIPAVDDSVRLSPNQSHVLTSGDKIRLGDTTLHFVMG